METLRLLSQLGWRNVLRNRRRNAILGVAILLAVATLILGAALIRGWQVDMRNAAIRDAGGELKVLPRGYRDDPQASRAFTPTAALLESLDAGRVTHSTRIVLPAVISSERETRGVQLLAVDPAYERAHGALARARFDGAALRDSQDAGILIGKELARRLDTRVGKRVVVLVNDADGVGRELGLRITGVFDLDGTGVELALAYVGRDRLAAVIANEPRVTEVAMRFADERALVQWRAALATQLPSLEVVTWRELQPQVAAMTDFVDSVIWITFGIMLTALSFGVANTLIAAVLERARELGLMFVLGMTRAQIVAQVVMESVLVVALGLLAGIVAGLAWVAWLADGIDLSRWAEGVELAGLSSRMVPALRGNDVVLASLLVLGLGALGALYPAWRAVRLNPLEALHGRKQ